MFMKKNLRHFHQSANPKATGEGLVHRSHHRRSHHLMGRGDTHFKMGAPLEPNQLGYSGGGGMSHKFRRPAPLKFKL